MSFLGVRKNLMNILRNIENNFHNTFLLKSTKYDYTKKNDYSYIQLQVNCSHL